MKILDTKVVSTKENKIKKSSAFILLEESKDKYVIVNYTAYKDWIKDGTTYHSVFLSEELARKEFDSIKED